MSSILGSISLNDQGGFYPYRTSKVNLFYCLKNIIKYIILILNYPLNSVFRLQ